LALSDARDKLLPSKIDEVIALEKAIATATVKNFTSEDRKRVVKFAELRKILKVSYLGHQD